MVDTKVTGAVEEDVAGIESVVIVSVVVGVAGVIPVVNFTVVIFCGDGVMVSG